MANRTAPQGGEAASVLQTTENNAYAHTLKMRMTTDEYRRLRRFVTGYEDRTSQRITQQAVLNAALNDYLDGQTS